MLELLLDEPMKKYTATTIIESQWHQETVVPIIFFKNKIRQMISFSFLLRERQH